MKTYNSLLIGLMSFLFSAQGAEVVIRVYHPHEVQGLIDADIARYPVTFEYADQLQYCSHLRPPESAVELRKKLKTNRITEEIIVIGELDQAKKIKYNQYIKMISAAEAAGWEWEDLIAYREPSFAALVNQPLMPGPWADLRMLSADDIEAFNKQIKEAFLEGKVKKDHYRMTQLIYCWKNIGEPEKAFILKNFAGAYIELNSRGGNWVVEGTKSELTRQNFDITKQYKIADFGDPGVADCADMAKWCLDNDLRFGVTMGSNLKDIWFKKMFEAFMVELRKRGVDPADPRITYVLHHNNETPNKMPYFPESEEGTMTNLSKYLIEQVGQLSKPK